MDLAHVDLLQLIGGDTSLRRVAATNGGEYAGPCPFCGGNDRFRVQPAAPGRGRWWCRRCAESERWHDAIDYVRRRQQLNYHAACARIGVAPSSARLPLPPAPPVGVEPPSPPWRAAAEALLSDAFDALYGDDERPLAWLQQRGFSDVTIARALLGYNARDRWMARSDWDLPSQRSRSGRQQRVWVPRGIVIPWFIGRGRDAAIWKLYVRRPLARSQKHCGEKSYIQIAGGSNGLYNGDAIVPTRPAMLVEGVFDALAVQQVAGDLVTPMATGTTGARRARWIALLSCAPVVFVSYDNDAAGEQAARYWLDALAPHAVRWRPFWDDPAAMLADDGELRAWVQTGLSVVAEARLG